MSSRSLNKVQLIGNLTRDPELRYTPQGTAVCTLGLATNRSWATEGGEKREETEFHRIVAWNKLAELCSQLLFKGRKIYVEGRLQTRSWVAQDGSQRQTTEVVIEEMIILDSRQTEPAGEGNAVKAVIPEEITANNTPLSEEPVPVSTESVTAVTDDSAQALPSAKKRKTEKTVEETEEIPVSDNADLTKDIPF